MKKSLLAAIEQQEGLASNGSLETKRAEALDRYLGRPYGDETEGRSKVVMRDVSDTIEWIMPSLLKVFCSGDTVVSFNPVGPEDEQQAEQETDYVNHVVMHKNNGFIVLHNWFKDALIQKNGYVLVQHEEQKITNKESYNGLTNDEFMLMVSQDDVEVLEHSEYLYGDMQSGVPPEILHDAVVRQISKYGCIKITNIPPERVKVSSEWNNVSLEDCPFVEVIDYKTVSQLRELGFDVSDDISDSDSDSQDRFVSQRRNVDDFSANSISDIESDPSTRPLRVRFVWIKFDSDDDGIAELRQVIVVGNTILEDEEVDVIPVASLCPIVMPHEHYGLSIDDSVSDLQRIRTVLVRGFLDSMYLANNGRIGIDSNRVNLDDLLQTRPGGVVRIDGNVNDALREIVHPQQGASILQAVEYIDSVRENRTGVTSYNQGLDANSLNKTASGITQIMTASQQRIELIARIFSETGIKYLMFLVHALSIKHGRKQEMVKLRNKWIPVDPRQWKTRRDMTVSVGLGTGNKDQMLGHLMMILQQQIGPGMQLGIASPVNVYNTLSKITQNAGFRVIDDFWFAPGSAPMPQQGPPPEVQKMQAELQLQQQKAVLDAQMKQQEMAHKQRMADLDERMAQFDLMMKQADFELKKRSVELQGQASIMQASDDMARALSIRGENNGKD